MHYNSRLGVSLGQGNMFRKLLIANRGEIAIRIMRTAHHLGIETLAVYSVDDAEALHVYRADHAVELAGTGVAAYLDIDQMVALAVREACDAVHPGYGMLSENPAFARACKDAGLTYIGPSVAALELFGDKSRARALAMANDVPVLRGTEQATTLDEAREFMSGLGGSAMIIKAVSGGGGRGVRVVTDLEMLAEAYQRSASEAEKAFGNDALYVEEFLQHARHIEVQIVGDSGGNILALGERDCSLQRRHQKIVEIAPAPDLDADLREQMLAAAVRLAEAAGYVGAGTIEFLVAEGRFAFIEANARLQVEHTVTEAVYDVDLVALQLKVADGDLLEHLELDGREPTGQAMQLRINTETMQADGTTMPQTGEIQSFDPPFGPGIRLDTYLVNGYRTNPNFDSMVAKLIVHCRDDDFASLVKLARRSLAEFRLAGVETNIDFLKALLSLDAVREWRTHTRFIDEEIGAILAVDHQRPLYRESSTAVTARTAGAGIDHSDPLAVLDYGQSQSAAVQEVEAYDDSWLVSPMQGTVIQLEVNPGDAVVEGQTVVIMDSMKMEHEINAMVSGRVVEVSVSAGDTIYQQQPLLKIEAGEVQGGREIDGDEIDPDYIRPDLAEVVARRNTTLDAYRPQAVERRRKTNQRTTRENIEDLCDPGTFVEYGQMVLAAQRRRRSIDELIEKSPADGMVTGVGSINGDLFGEPDNRCAVMSYDYTVFAGTQGGQNHRKTDRMIRVAEEGQMPLVLFAEGGGGRPGDTDGLGGEGTTTFARFAQLSGLVPMVGITSGRCFAGNASLLGCCDLIIATENSNIGMGGPAMIEGGGLGIYAPEEIGPMSVQVANGVVDKLVRDEAEAVAVAKKYLSYFQGPVSDWVAPDQRRMRHVIPENRLRVYEIREVIDTLADEGSTMYLREGWGHGTVTAFIRVEGKPLGVVANNPRHLGGAIDSDAADKASRFMQLCDAFDIPLLYLCDTPGIMVGPEIEKTALVRHSSRMFLTGANLSVPFFTIILRKAYGLGAIAMAGGSYKTPFFTVSWPTGEFGGMGLEGSVKLGYRAELAAIEDPQERLAKYEEMVARAYQNGKALNYASLFSVDDTIDPADSRFWVSNLMKSMRLNPRVGKKRPCVDAW